MYGICLRGHVAFCGGQQNKINASSTFYCGHFIVLSTKETCKSMGLAHKALGGFDTALRQAQK